MWQHRSVTAGIAGCCVLPCVEPPGPRWSPDSMKFVSLPEKAHGKPGLVLRPLPKALSQESSAYTVYGGGGLLTVTSTCWWL